MSQRMAVDDWREMIDKTEAQSDAEPVVQTEFELEDGLHELAFPAQSDAEPDPTKVICPNCAHQFGAISVADQERLRAQSNAEPVADIDLAIDKVLMFRLERMDDGVIWICLYRENGDDKVIWLNSPSTITANVEDDKDEPIAPPRPEASAGLIEALEALVIDCENKWGDPHTLAEARAALTTLRARAADRSGND